LSRALVIAGLLVSSAARADETGTSTGLAYAAAGVAAGIFDIAYTIYDSNRLAHGEPGSGYAGLFEILGAAPQIGVATKLVLDPPPWGPARPLAIVWGLWATALTAHGIWSVASATAAKDDVHVVIGPLGCAGAWRF
jgi:hypothetical protein